MRKPTSTIEYIEFARGYAIFTIVLYHVLQRVPLAPLLQKAIIFGGTGVHLFFLLSGFGLGLSKNQSINPINFYKRRLIKVWLPYVLVLTLSFWAAFFLNLFPDRFSEWLAGVFLYQMFDAEKIQSFGGHFWFISTIVQFYLIFPLLVWAKNRLNSPLIFAGFGLLISIFWWEIVYFLDFGNLRNWSSCCLQFLWEFTLGMALADIFQKNENEKGLFRGDFWNHAIWKNFVVGVIFTGLMILMILKMGDTGKIFNDIPAMIGYTALSIFIFQIGEKWLPFLKNFFVWLGGFSYSFYLIHILVLTMYLRVFEIRGIEMTLPKLLPFVIFTIGVAWAWEPISRWFTGLFEKILNKKPTEKLPELN